MNSYNIFSQVMDICLNNYLFVIYKYKNGH